MTRIVGFTGYPEHGKSSAANALIKVYNYQRVAFAAPVKLMLLQLSGVTEAHVYGDKKNEPIPECGGRTARHMMETLGTKWGREMIHSDLWVNQSAVIFKQLLAEGKYLVFDDVRFPNEADVIRKLGGKVIRVVRTGHPVDMTLPANQFIADIQEDAKVWNEGPNTALIPWHKHFAHQVFSVCRMQDIELNLRKTHD